MASLIAPQRSQVPVLTSKAIEKEGVEHVNQAACRCKLQATGTRKRSVRGQGRRPIGVPMSPSWHPRPAPTAGTQGSPSPDNPHVSRRECATQLDFPPPHSSPLHVSRLRAVKPQREPTARRPLSHHSLTPSWQSTVCCPAHSPPKAGYGVPVLLGTPTPKPYSLRRYPLRRQAGVRWDSGKAGW